MTAAALNPTPESEPHPARAHVARPSRHPLCHAGGWSVRCSRWRRLPRPAGPKPDPGAAVHREQSAGRKVLLGRACKRGTWPPPAFRHFAGSRDHLYPCEPTHRCVAYAVGARGTAVWRCRVGSDEPVGVAAHRGWSQPDPGCGISQWPHRARPVRRPAHRVLRKEGGGGRVIGLLEKQARCSAGSCDMGGPLQPKGTQPDASTPDIEHTDTKAAGVQAGTTSFASFKGKNVSPLSHPPRGRRCAKARGRGQRVRKQTPPELFPSIRSRLETIEKSKKQVRQLQQVALRIPPVTLTCRDGCKRMRRVRFERSRSFLDCGYSPVILHKEWPNTKKGHNNEQHIDPAPPDTLCAGRQPCANALRSCGSHQI